MMDIGECDALARRIRDSISSPKAAASFFSDELRATSLTFGTEIEQSTATIPRVVIISMIEKPYSGFRK